MHQMTPLSDNPDDYCFADTETRSLPDLDDPRWGNVTMSGAKRYGTSCMVTIFRYCIGDGPMRRWDALTFDGKLDWQDAPDDLLDFRDKALGGEGWFVFWNSFFDRNVVNHGMVAGDDDVTMPVRTVIDAMAQAVAANLPADLEGASKAIKRNGKMMQGKKLIEQFAPANGDTPQTHPEDWATFQDYADVDVEELRAVFQATRPLWRWEWEQFWASEHVNDTGLPMDRLLAEGAAEIAEVYAGQVNTLISQFSREQCWSVNQHVALANHVADELEHLPEAFNILVKSYEEDEEGDGLIPKKLSLERTRVEKLIAYLERMDRDEGLTDEEFDVLQLLEVRLFGASNTPKKFAKMLPMLDERDRLCGQYTFNGAQQTGRFSSRGLQVHNLARKTIDDEVGAIEFLTELAEPKRTQHD